MNWKRGLTRIYIVFWALGALIGALVVASMNGSEGAPVAANWIGWGVVCLVLPAIALAVLTWIGAGFGKSEVQPPVPSAREANTAQTKEASPLTTLERDGAIGVTAKANWLLTQAATHGDMEAVTMAFEFGADANTHDEQGCTPLMAAATNGNDEVIRYLLSRGADISLRTNIGSTALHFACARGAPTTVALLIDAGANPEARDDYGSASVFDTIYMENIPVLEWFLARGTNRESRRDDGSTMLIMAAALGRLKVLDLLLQSGANAEARDLAGQTSLLTSLSHSHAEAARLLLDRGASPSPVDGRGRTALHHAAYGGLVGLCRRLLELGSDPNARDGDGETPLHVAVKRGFPTIQTMLMEAGADTRLKTTDGKSLDDLDRGAGEYRQVTEKIRLLRSLPAAISLDDARKLLAIWDRQREKDEDAERAWHDERFLLDDLVHAYRTNPERVGDTPFPLDKVIAEATKIHPGETP